LSFWLNLNVAKLQKKSLAESHDIRQILEQFWGYSEFRPLQEEIIQSVLDGRDTLALMPTGGGKSLTFQVPSLAMDGICIVITPLIALMKDQVEQLQRRKVKAAALHSGMTRGEIDITLENCRYGDYKFLYVSPERLGTEIFKTRVREMNVNLIAVDEAHCISQWGYDFRPSYLEISGLRELLPEVPVLALTATATPEVCADIQERLLFREKNLLRKSFDRENLTYAVRHHEDKTGELLRMVQKLKGSGIVYVRSRRKCRELAELLAARGVPANYYHAGLTHALRDERQQGWSRDQFRVMVATNAFGMGIDKPDVRFVIHTDLPDAPEAYFQEAGRAGRDGKPAWAILLYNGADKKLVKQRLVYNFPPIPKIREIYTALCNFLQIPLGSGKGQQFDFELGEFLHRYRLNAALTLSALQVLSREGYIAMTEAFENPSRILFTVGRDDLYGFQVKNAELDGFIKLLLRSYSGLFSQYVRIDEAFLAKRSGIPLSKIRHYLNTLSSRQIITYIPRKEVPVITFLEERLDQKNLLISPERYYFRKQSYERRSGEMLRYAESRTRCRNQFLLSYFGQLDSSRCGRCDVCRSPDIMDPEDPRFQSIQERLTGLLTGGSMAADELVATSGMEAEQVLQVLEWLMDRGWITRQDDLTLKWEGPWA
jgi:ATP-dependent DNA helicase RecQ